MLNLKLITKRFAIALIGAAILTTSVSAVSYADPPRWAKAHGHHHKHHKKHARKHHRHDHKVVYVERRAFDDRDKRYRPGSGWSAPSGGTILGALLGAAAGTQVGKGKGRMVAILGGAVLGGVLGSEIGQSMDASDQAQTQQILESNRTGQSTIWNNPDTGSEYRVMPTRTYKSGKQDCRDFTTWAVIDGYEEEVKGTACRQPNGVWKQLKI